MELTDRVIDMPEKLFNYRSCFQYKKESLKVVTVGGKFICQKCFSVIEHNKAKNK
jgi:hypothetical protein